MAHPLEPIAAASTTGPVAGEGAAGSWVEARRRVVWVPEPEASGDTEAVSVGGWAVGM